MLAYQSLTTGGWCGYMTKQSVCALYILSILNRIISKSEHWLFFYFRKTRIGGIKKDSVLWWLKPVWRQNEWTKEHGRWSRLMNILTGKIKIWSSVLLQILLLCSNHLSCLLFSFLCSLKAAFVTCPDVHEYSRDPQEYLSCCWLSQADFFKTIKMSCRNLPLDQFSMGSETFWMKPRQNCFVFAFSIFSMRHEPLEKQKSAL